jgi:hypothetical protein
MIKKGPKAYVVAVDMGYGHLRAAYPLKNLAVNGIINANNYLGIPHSDRKIWKQSRQFYEKISKFKSVPIIGEKVWQLFDHFQAIPKFYPEKDLSAPNLQVKATYELINKKNWGKHLIEKLDKKPLPLITSFFAVAFMAEEFDYRGSIYCLVCDADISRAWAPLQPNQSRIKYLAPTERVMRRLLQYGVRQENIIVSGFPLPESLTCEVKKDLLRRLKTLDPKNIFFKRYGDVIRKKIGSFKNVKASKIVKLVFAVGGAGAQRDIGEQIIGGLKDLIRINQVELVLVAGIHNEVASFFRRAIRQNGLSKYYKTRIKIVAAPAKMEYFSRFNAAIKKADILWTKPSELSFYSQLGLPVIIAPPIGSQEDFNASWLLKMGAGIAQNEPLAAGEWLIDWLDNGWLAEAAMQGYVEGNYQGLKNIEKIIK